MVRLVSNPSVVSYNILPKQNNMLEIGFEIETGSVLSESCYFSFNILKNLSRERVYCVYIKLGMSILQNLLHSAKR